MNIKVQFLINTISKPAGTERVTCVIANELASRGYDVEIVCMYNHGESFYDLHNDVDVSYLLNKKGGGLIQDYAALLNALRKKTKGADYIIGVGMDLCIFTAPLRLFNRKIKVIGWEHFNLSVKGPVINLARRLGILFINKIVTITEGDFLVYRKKFKSDKVLRIYNPATINAAPVNSYDKKVVLGVGRLTNQKGFDMLIESWAGLKEKHADWKLIIIGNGEERENLLKKAGEYKLSGDHLEIIPAVKNIQDYYYRASIYALSSRFEGLPLVLLESQSIGLPVVSFDCETGPREVIVNGENGFLVKPFNIEDFKGKLELLMDSEELRTEMGHKAVSYSTQFSTENIIQKWVEIIN